MTIIQHAGISAVLGLGLWWHAGPIAALACLLAGVFVDLDHLFDYIMNYSLRNFNLRHFHHVFRYEVLERVFVLLHAWEFVFITWLGAWRFHWHPIWLGAAIGFSAHLLLDQIFNAHTPAAYMLAYRILRKFNCLYFYGEHEINRRRSLTKSFSQKTGVTSEACR